MLVLLLTLTALADAIHCTGIEQKALVYDHGTYVGGAAPGGEIPVFWQSWSIDESSLYDHQRMGDGQSRTSGDLLWTWDQDDTVVISSTNPSQGITKTVYTTTATLWRADGAPITKDLGARVTVPMRCERSVDMNPYP